MKFPKDDVKADWASAAGNFPSPESRRDVIGLSRIERHAIGGGIHPGPQADFPQPAALPSSEFVGWKLR